MSVKRHITYSRFRPWLALLCLGLLAGACSPAETAATPDSQPSVTTTNAVVDSTPVVTFLTADSISEHHTRQTSLGGFLAEIGYAPPPGARILADGRPVDPAALAAQPLPQQIVIDLYKTISVAVGDDVRGLRTQAPTVGEALREAGVIVGPLDTVAPPADSPLTDGLQIAIQRAAPYQVTADGALLEVSSDATDVAGILADSGLALGPMDYTRPPLGAPVRPGDAIEIVRVAEQIIAEEFPVDFETVYEAAPDLELDTLVQASEGSPGVLQRRTRLRLENGVEVSRAVDSEILLVAPVNRVFRYGTNIVVRVIETPEGPAEYWRVINMQVTSYTAASAGKPPDHPGYGITASGVQAGKGVVAIDPTVVPFKSYVYVPGYGVAYAGDTGGGVRGRFIDLGFDDDNYESWSGRTDVYLLGQPPPPDKIQYILP